MVCVCVCNTVSDVLTSSLYYRSNLGSPRQRDNRNSTDLPDVVCTPPNPPSAAGGFGGESMVQARWDDVWKADRLAE